MSLDHHFAEPTAIRTNLGAIFVSLELSRSTWLITSLSPGGGEKVSVPAAGQDRQDRRRSPGARSAGVQTR